MIGQRLVDGPLIVRTAQAKRRTCPTCGRRAGVLSWRFLEHFTINGLRCQNSGQPVPRGKS